jgi:hypothetical protein
MVYLLSLAVSLKNLHVRIIPSSSIIQLNFYLVCYRPNHASILSAEATAILVLDIISQSTKQELIILSDSLPCVNAVENRNLENPLVVEIVERVHQQLHVDRRISFVWVPSHIGIAVNMAVDAVAKAGFILPISNAEIPHTDLKPLILSQAKIVGNFVGTRIPTTCSSKYSR